LSRNARTLTIKRETIPITVTEVGQIEPKEYEVVTAPISAILIEIVKDGKYVHKGEVVARMNDDEAREELEMQALAIKNREAMLRKAQLDLEETIKDLGFESQKAQLELELAELDLKDLEGKPAAPVAALVSLDPAYWRTAKDIALKLGELDVELGRVAEETSLKKYQRQQFLATKGVVSENDVASARLTYEKDRTVHENARIVLDLLRKGTPESDIETAKERAKQTKVKLAQVKESVRVRTELKKTAVAQAQAELNRTKEWVEINRKIVASVMVKAPADGTALYWGPWDRPKEGDYVWRENGFLSITQTGKMLAVTRVSEVDSRRISVGQRALIRLEAIPGKTYHGKVVRMAGLAVDRDERFQGILRKDLSGIMVFEVTVEIDQMDPAMRPTMSGTVEIITEELPGAIAVPITALIERDGKTFVKIMGKWGVTEREVQIGHTWRSRVIVSKGLKEGDVLCLM
jgi:multidrug efflux pump subunit AcrA (membrane-fusion protein)